MSDNEIARHPDGERVRPCEAWGCTGTNTANLLLWDLCDEHAEDQRRTREAWSA